MPLLVRNVALCFLLLLFSNVTTAEPAKCRYGMISKLPLHYHGNSMMLAAEGQINGTPATMVIDTGAASTLLTRFATDKRSLRRDATGSAAIGVGGSTRVFNVPIKHFQIGPISSDVRGNLPAIDEMGRRPDFDALVGSDFLMQFDMEISLAEKQLRFFSPANCERTFLGYWDKAAVEVPLLIERRHRRPMVEVEFNGVKMKALIDTGATVSGISQAGAKRAGVTLASPAVKPAGEVVGIGRKVISVHSARFDTFSIGDEKIMNASLRILENEFDEFDVVLGTDFLRAHRILFAVSQRKVYLSYIGGIPFSDAKGSPWIEEEAEGGNGYAQYKMALGGLNAGDAAARAAGMQWMDKAVANKNLSALHHMARQRGRDGRFADSVALYEQALVLDGYDMNAQLETFVMRTKAGLPEQAKAGLAKGMAQFRWPPWPAPITDYYLGKIKIDDLLREAGSEPEVAKRRQCDVYRHASALEDARGQAGSAKALAEKAKAECSPEFDS